MAVFSKMLVLIDKVMQFQNSEDYSVNIITENINGYTKIVIALLLPVWDIFQRIIVPVVEALWLFQASNARLLSCSSSGIIVGEGKKKISTERSVLIDNAISFKDLMQLHETWIWSLGGIIVTGENQTIKGKPGPMPLCPAEIPDWLGWDQTQASAVRGRWLTIWPVAQLKAVFGTNETFTEQIGDVKSEVPH